LTSQRIDHADQQCIAPAYDTLGTLTRRLGMSGTIQRNPGARECVAEGHV